ncbi:poly(ethylene terephthalate) hydrolase family protein [Actinomadura macrotermitis]|uniref:poly(ethylene terephthalate) hydrolase n=1 Tax=Actinomadura macrotermitis TaxID=2585200 RepID=A0A7K0BW34_9ACTN|nr:acetylxylan esterase [Actinomadura macrotermitis]MQY05393.1 hypothetical protein [Actinomadura macrotermitis]
MPRRARIAALAAAPLIAAGAFAVVPAAAPAPAAPVPTAALAATTAVNWAQAGPSRVTVDDAPHHRIYRPANLGAKNTRHAVVIWGNGTGATPAAYDKLLRHWASHGFIVAAAKTKSSNNGVQMRQGLDLLAKRNSTPSSPYYRRVDLGHVAAAGHSQGGAGALNAAADRRVDAVLPIQPGPLASPGKVRQPTLYMAGEKDKVVKPGWVLGDYNVSGNRPAAYAEIRGAGHVASAGNGGAFRGMATAWLYFTLRNDAGARAMFGGPSCGYCSDTTLLSQWKRNAKFLAFAR